MYVWFLCIHLYRGHLHDVVPAQWLAPVEYIGSNPWPWPVAKVSNDDITGAMYSAMLAALESENGVGWAHKAYSWWSEEPKWLLQARPL